jgi:hypothetical protein
MNERRRLTADELAGLLTGALFLVAIVAGLWSVL